MAGTDCFLDINEGQRTLAQILLRASQRRARALGLTLRYRRERGRYYISLDGPLPMMQAFARAVARDLPAVAEGFSAAKHQVRNRIAARLVREIASSVARSERQVADVAVMFRGAPVSHRFDAGARTHLAGHLGDFEQLLHLYAIGEVEPRHILEEAHTITEALLREVLVERAKGKSFEGMAREAHAQGLLAPDELAGMLALKEHRKAGKHRGQGVSGTVADEILSPTTSGCHRLLALIRGEELLPIRGSVVT